MDQTVQIINFNEIDLIGVEIELTKSQDENYFLIRELWKKFNSELKNIKNRKSGNWEKFGVTYRKNYQVFYMASIKKTNKMIIPQNMIAIKVNRGKYVCFVHVGAMYDIKTTIYNIYKKIIPKLEFEIESNKKEGLIHFERYDHRFKWNNPKSLLEIYLPVNTYEHK
ncbi:MAG: GyrI-like domain-containing protein [bacterium]